MELFWWFLTIVLFAVGLIGTIAPVLPGTTIILAAAIIHRIMLGPDKSIGWHTIIVLMLLTLATYGLDVLAGYFGAQLAHDVDVVHEHLPHKRTYYWA